MLTTPVTSSSLLAAKERGERQVWLTAYDCNSAQLAELAGVDVLLVGDSLGMTLLGYDSTVPVTLEQMIHHCRAVVRGRSRCWVVGDMPFGSYQQNPEQALTNAIGLLQQSGCDAVKIEGGQIMVPTVEFLTARGVAVVGHIGLQPQSIKQVGHYRRFGRSQAEKEQLLTDGYALARAGATAIVVECVLPEIAGELSAGLPIPIIGIGSGPNCDGQVLVWHDLLGLSERNPSFAPAYLDLRQQITGAISRWGQDVRQGASSPVVVP